MADRPLTGNSSGKYNLNFIDPNNDIAAYYDGLTDLQQLIQEYFETMSYEEYEHMSEEQIKKLCLNESFCESKEKFKKADICSICLCKFMKKQKVTILPCSHSFHAECVNPWFSKNEKCPNCRYNLKEQGY